jgi:AraC-like DNA-binding protein
MVAIALYMMLRFVSSSHNFILNQFSNLLRYALMLSVHPLFFLYIKSLTKEKFTLFHRNHLYCFLPSLLTILFMFVHLIVLLMGQVAYATFVQKTALNSIYVALILHHAQLFVYGVLMILLMIQHKKNIMENFSFTEKIKLNWLLLCLYVYVIFNMTDFISVILFLTNTSPEFITHLSTFFLVLFTLFISFLGYFGVKQIDVYKGTSDSYRIDNENNTSLNIDIDIANNSSIQKYSTSNLTEEISEKILKSLIEIMENNKAYTNPKLSATELADILHVNKKYLSQTINERLGKNFFQFINEYRVEYAKTLLIDEKNKHLTIESIGAMAGFQTAQSLITAFKKIEGMLPSEYVKKMKN